MIEANDFIEVRRPLSAYEADMQSTGTIVEMSRRIKYTVVEIADTG